MKNLMHLNKYDNVVVALHPIPKGETVSEGDISVTVNMEIPKVIKLPWLI